MPVISQNKDKVTGNLEFSIIETKTAKQEFIPKDVMQKFKQITQKRDDDNSLSLKELKGIGVLLGEKMITTVYMVVEANTRRNFGTYTTKEKARTELVNILKAKNIYEMQQDKGLGLEMF